LALLNYYYYYYYYLIIVAQMFAFAIFNILYPVHLTDLIQHFMCCNADSGFRLFRSFVRIVTLCSNWLYTDIKNLF